jgi:hypothetical protein
MRSALAAPVAHPRAVDGGGRHDATLGECNDAVPVAEHIGSVDALEGVRVRP